MAILPICLTVLTNKFTAEPQRLLATLEISSRLFGDKIRVVKMNENAVKRERRKSYGKRKRR